ncbi:hypothetical protein PSQ39_15720 [Curvibacter sp. HBC28]|uniref:General secretion pathway protein GspL n=1 Tax=Curvibacter microcysteis TaxID=3026419 RepID=A0ABT5MHL2_9BURK|nr:hypothetical protein [Curvibacter sp. HBC28]MDD0816086.1 hypothetical protein [Curvibacter sp. HBC28]
MSFLPEADPALHWVWQGADSELAELAPRSLGPLGPQRALRWAAAAVAARAPGAPAFMPPLRGHVRDWRLWLDDGAGLALPPAQGALQEATLHCDGQRWPALALPSELQGELSLCLRWRQGGEWHWQGRWLRAEGLAGLPFFASLAC